jgi:hypothetical protein
MANTSSIPIGFIPDWENEHGRKIEVVFDPEDENVCVSDIGHAGIRIRMFKHYQCEQCAGGDDWGHDFCPVCDYCCGC